ncbi:hypothetical protein CXG81DRAFT_19285 [Caulochytrium protostelioides]|uniref:Malto-oligosyltrehalose trehalohydrolase n=1 Tax=Caulochytrium protostelioides TaxID=1555241 RepID=A0A4V1IUK2_9FUNG|nr:hypothetical protein CXG81DRAFT_19285 [Caulochytrium protostelioides]|eukprot:RKP00849.1 hypothetical protein CXG81DRAFT_19285 [Caulochytrium protostelioides]
MAIFDIWAPKAQRAELQLGGHTYPMAAAKGAAAGTWRADVPDAAAKAGTDYGFLLYDAKDALIAGKALPDPRATWLPNGVHALGRIDDPTAHTWHDAAWTGRALNGGVVYEMHVGTFTPEGTFDAAIAKLAYLRDLGITHVELLPVNAFNGPHGWGYDGVAWYAVHEAYGGPSGLRRLVDAAHAHGLAVILDVVYNHLGPSGAYLSAYAPYFNDKHKTPWGAALNLDGDQSHPVRRYILDNVSMWFRDFHIDGLRLDAVHALVDESGEHILKTIARLTDTWSAALQRPISLIAESDLNDPRMVEPMDVSGAHGLTAQWSDDFHHVLHTLLTGERQGYYGDFGSLASLEKVLTRIFFHDGTHSSFRGRDHGRPVNTDTTPGYRFLGYLQDHDQIGNRATGDRITQTLSHGKARIGAALYLLSTYTPMVFMGEEWAASTPWAYFSSHPEPELAAAVRKGRRAEFASHGWKAEDVPDPQDPQTFAMSKLKWDEATTGSHATMLAWYRALLRLRRATPALASPQITATRVCVKQIGDPAEGRGTAVVARDADPLQAASYQLVVNLDTAPQTIALLKPPSASVITTGEVLLWSGDAAYAAEPVPAPPVDVAAGTVTLAPETVLVLRVA